MIVTLQHQETGLVKRTPLGFSWTTLFFGFFPALMRGDIKWSLIMLLTNFLTGGLSNFVFPFFYNRVYMNDLLQQGYILASPNEKRAFTTHKMNMTSRYYEEDREWE